MINCFNLINTERELYKEAWYNCISGKNIDETLEITIFFNILRYKSSYFKIKDIKLDKEFIYDNMSIEHCLVIKGSQFNKKIGDNVYELFHIKSANPIILSNIFDYIKETNNEIIVTAIQKNQSNNLDFITKHLSEEKIQEIAEKELSEYLKNHLSTTETSYYRNLIIGDTLKKVADKFIEDEYSNHRNTLNEIFNKVTSDMINISESKEDAIRDLYWGIEGGLKSVLEKYMETNKETLQNIFDKRVKGYLEKLSNYLIEETIKKYVDLNKIIDKIIKE